MKMPKLNKHKEYLKGRASTLEMRINESLKERGTWVGQVHGIEKKQVVSNKYKKK